MTDRQKLRRAELERLLGRPDPKAVETGIYALLTSVLTRHLRAGTLVLHSDDHPAYRRALRRVRRHPKLRTRIRHHVTSSTLRRTCRNPLFPVNLADLLIRHASANHRRETIAFSKRRQAALERLALFAVWRNAIKRRRENGPVTTAAMEVGLTSRPLTWRDVFSKRLFPRHHDLSRTWRAYYWRRVKTAVLGRGADNAPLPLCVLAGASDSARNVEADEEEPAANPRPARVSLCYSPAASVSNSRREEPRILVPQPTIYRLRLLDSDGRMIVGGKGVVIVSR